MPVSLRDVLRQIGAGAAVAGRRAGGGRHRLLHPHPARGLAGARRCCVCLFGLTLMDSAIIPLLLVVPILVSYRVAIGGVDLTFSDAALFFAFFPAAIFAQRPYTPAMRSLLWCGVTYEVLTLFTVIANPYRANAIEWVHAGLLTVGALVVGWSIGREGHARLGLTLILLACSVARGRRSIVQGLIAVRRRRLQRRLPALALRHAQELRRLPLRHRRRRRVRAPDLGEVAAALRAGLLLDLPRRHRGHPVPPGDGRAWRWR